MNYWYNISHENFLSKITIPSYNPDNNQLNKLILHRAYIHNKNWKFESVKENFIDYEIIANDYNKDSIYFLYDENLNNIRQEKLISRANFLNTSPSYRANMSITIRDQLKTCYQGEYSSFMFAKRGTTLSFQNSCLNKRYNNYLIFTNYIDEPVKNKFELKLVNVKSKKVVKNYLCQTNCSNIFKLDNSMNSDNCILLTRKYLGVPQLFSYSIEEGSVSFEHTQPPHCYVWESKYISKLKKDYIKIFNNSFSNDY